MPSKVVLTGNKRADKVYYWHTGYPGGIKERTAAKILEGKHPERVLHKAVERMVPRGPLGRQQMKNLRIYAGRRTSPRGAEPDQGRYRRHEQQERKERLKPWPI